MEDIDKRIDEIIKELEGAASANGYWQPEKLMDYVPEMYAIIKQLQAQVVERDILLVKLAQGLELISKIEGEATCGQGASYSVAAQSLNEYQAWKSINKAGE